MVVKGDEMAAIEVKSGAFFQENWCAGLRAFGTPAGLRRRIVVCPETPDLRTPDGIDVISFRGLAGLLHQDLLFAGGA